MFTGAVWVDLFLGFFIVFMACGITVESLLIVSYTTLVSV